MTEPAENKPALHPSERLRRISWPLVLIIVLVLLAAAVVLVIQALLRPVDRIAEGAQYLSHKFGDSTEKAVDAGLVAANKLASAIERRFSVQPTISTQTQVVTTAPRDLAQLVVVEQIVPVRREVTHEFLKSTKRLVATGEFRVLAGYDLAEPFAVVVEQNGDVVIRAPQPRILAVETQHIEVEGMDGLWNKISDEERNEALADLRAEARSASTQALLEEARDAIRRIVANQGSNWRVEWIVGASPEPTTHPLLP